MSDQPILPDAEATPSDPVLLSDSRALAELRVKYQGMLVREKKYEQILERLRRQRAQDRQSLAEARQRLEAVMAELSAVRTSWRFRVGSWLVAPLGWLRHLARRPTPVTATAPAEVRATPRPAAAAPLSPQELESRYAQNPSLDNAFAYAKAAFYVNGEIDKAHRAIADFDRALLAAHQRQVLDVIQGLWRLGTQALPLPPRQPNPNLVPIRGRVLYCVHGTMPYLTNGYSTRTHGVAWGGRRAGVDMVVAARPGFPWDTRGTLGDKAERRRHELTQDAVPYVFTPGLHLENMPLDHYIAAAADAFAREAVRHRAEVIHAASNHITGLAALLAARRLGLPFVYEVRGLWEVTQASERPQWGRSDRYRLAVRLETLVAQEADWVLAITDELRQELVARGVPRQRIDLLPNCVDIDAFAPATPTPALVAELGLNPAVPTIGFAGSVVPYEGLEQLAEALGQLAQRGVGFNLLIVGDGSGLPALKAAVEAAGIASVTRFTGRVPRERVRELMSAMDVMPCPRRGSAVTEMVSPLKPLEAMAMGKAVLLSDVSPHLEFAGPDQERARLFRKDDLQDLADQLASLLRDAALRSRLGRAARLWVARQRTWDVAGRILQQAYRAAQAQAASLAEAEETVVPARRLGQLRLGLIADRFTSDSLAPDIALVRPTPDNWRELLQASPIDALLVESAWEGNGGAWTRRVGYYGDEEIRPLRELVEHCRARGIPTLFWNKEDPVHFSRFERTAAMFDHVFTTDSHCIARYLATAGTLARTASSLPFFAQPAIHNPLPSTRPWSHDVCYAGSYYGDRYADRSRRLDMLLTPAAKLGLTIYDRQHARPDSPYHFPDPLRSFVKGGLDYADMVQAYKSHAVHLNVNSVGDSPTMFSRRVMEIAASGTAVLSAKGRGVDETLGGTIVTVDDEARAAQILGDWLGDERRRHAAVVAPLREVLRAHTAQHRLVQMLRTGGLRILAPELPRYALVCRQWTRDLAQAVSAQTRLPQVVIAGGVEPGLPPSVQVVVPGPQECVRDVLAAQGCAWVGAVTQEASSLADPHLYEDLLLTTRWHHSDGVGVRWLPATARPSAPVPLVAVDQPLSASDGVLRVSALKEGTAVGSASIDELFGHRSTGVVMNRFAPAPDAAQRFPEAPPRTVLVAGHDLKFLRQVMSHWEAQGHRVLVDAWTGHNAHDEARSLALLEQADMVFCEWCLGNAAWFSRHKRDGQRLVVRFHSQELRSPLTAGVVADRVDCFVFVGAHIRDKAIAAFGFDPARCVVVPNYVADAMFQSREGDLPKTLGLVGITPQMKRLDLALDLIRLIRQRDPAFRLIVKGRRPEEYAWMKSRPQEMAYYEAQYARIRDDQLLAEGVQFEPHGDDMGEFYRRIGYAISVSDFESFHLTLADGAASQAMPLSLDWEGADRIYPPTWLCGSVAEMADRILHAASLDRHALASMLRDNAEYCRLRFALSTVAATLDHHCFAMDVPSP
jgi:glycosyltransferase involved in cell wall biosynthesis/spore maturation protein CgeB